MILLDGPMGTELEARGVATPAPGWSAYALESAPELVRAVHAAYAAAGAEVHRTNTFRTQRRVFGDRAADLVAIAVRLARAACGSARLAGSIAPVFDCYRPDLSPPEPEARAAHADLASALARAGVDLLVCETLPHPGEARIAVEEAVLTGLETWVALTAGPDGSLMTPDAMANAARDCAAAGATAVLVCCTSAALTLPYVERLAHVGVPFGAYANASGDTDVARYLDHARAWRDAGATILGSCCGTSPRHIAALRSLMDSV